MHLSTDYRPTEPGRAHPQQPTRTPPPTRRHGALSLVGSAAVLAFGAACGGPNDESAVEQTTRALLVSAYLEASDATLTAPMTLQSDPGR